MATTKQMAAAKRNIKRARAAASRKPTIANLPKATRTDLGKRGAAGRARHGRPGTNLDDRNRQQPYELAKRKRIPGRSKMGRAELVRALRRAG